jgi:ribosomal protein S27AE
MTLNGAPGPARGGAFVVRGEDAHVEREAELRESLECEMCGAPVIANHCKRICLRCGFMTGCSEGI